MSPNRSDESDQADKLDEMANDLDELKTTADELEENAAAGSERAKVDILKRSLADASDAADDLSDHKK
jgi:hypothetical protein